MFCIFVEEFFAVLSFDGGIKKIKELKLNISQLNSDKYYKVRDKL